MSKREDLKPIPLMVLSSNKRAFVNFDAGEHDIDDLIVTLQLERSRGFTKVLFNAGANNIDAVVR